MFRDDHTVLHIRRPKVQYAYKEQMMVIQGNPETKNLKDMLPDIMKQVGPSEYEYLKDAIIA